MYIYIHTCTHICIWVCVCVCVCVRAVLFDFVCIWLCSLNDHARALTSTLSVTPAPSYWAAKFLSDFHRSRLSLQSVKQETLTGVNCQISLWKNNISSKVNTGQPLFVQDLTFYYTRGKGHTTGNRGTVRGQEREDGEHGRSNKNKSNSLCCWSFSP